MQETCVFVRKLPRMHALSRCLTLPQEEKSEESKRTDFSKSTWRNANFTTTNFENADALERTKHLQIWLKENFWYETEDEKQASLTSENNKIEEEPVASDLLKAKTTRRKKSPFPANAVSESGKGDLGG